MNKRAKLISRMMILLLATAGCVQEPVPEQTGQAEEFTIKKTSFPDKEFLITDYGAVDDGITVNAEAINAAVEACNQAGGGRVIIPRGLWITGPIRLRSNVNLHAEDGALVRFTGNFDDYPFIRSYYEGRKDYRATPMIYGDSVENIAITGKGIFDGSGDAWRPVKKMKTTGSQWRALVASGGQVSKEGDVWWPNKYAYEVSLDPGKYRSILDSSSQRDLYKAFFRPSLVQLISCDRVLLEGPLFQNSPGWCIHPLMCTNLTVNDIRVKNPWYAQNGDGIDVESCTYVSIRNSHFDVGDDAVCIKSGKDEEGRRRGIPTRYVVVDNCLVHHGHGGFVVGSEMSGGVKDIWVSNCTFIGTDVGLRFKSTRGRGGVVENIHIDHITMVDIARDAIIFNLFYAGLAPTEMGEDPIESLISNAPEVTEETPEFRNISIGYITCDGADRALQIIGLPEMPVGGLSLSNSSFSTDRGIHCLFARDLRIENVKVLTKDHPTMNLVNVNGALISSVTGNNELLCTIDGSKTKGLTIRSKDIPDLESRIKKSGRVPEDAVTLEQ